MTTDVPLADGDKRQCGGPLRHRDGTCRRPAGWGTPHPGIGRCKLHGGSTRSHVAWAERTLREQQVAAAQERYGIPVQVDPGPALTGLLHETYGAVLYLGALVASLPAEELKQVDSSGRFERPAVWVEMLAARQKALGELAKDLVSLGLAEREVKVQEQTGQLLAAGLSWLLGRLGLAGDPRAMELLGVMLRSLAEGRVPDELEGEVVA